MPMAHVNDNIIYPGHRFAFFHKVHTFEAEFPSSLHDFVSSHPPHPGRAQTPFFINSKARPIWTHSRLTKGWDLKITELPKLEM